MKKIATSILLIFIVSAIIQALPVQAVTPKENAIDLGLKWLAKQQDTTTGAWSLGYYPVASTAFAVIKFAEYKHTTGDATYDSNVTAGLKYLLSSGSSFQVNIAADLTVHPEHWTGSGTPATNGDGIGIYFRSTVGASDSVGTYSTTYETGIVMMAFQAADASGFINRNHNVPVGSDPAILGKTYYTVMGDMVNFYAWAQNDASSGSARGGWRYLPNMEDPNPWGASSDNSISQWAALGLISAEDWGIFAPVWVKSELRDHWLAYSQNTNGGFGYTDSSSPYIPMTAAGLIELTYCGVPTTDPRWDAARSFIGNNWASDNIGNMYAMYGVMKAAMTARPLVIWDFGVHKWQPEYDDNLVNVTQVKPAGYWPATGRDTAPTQILATEWALLILEKIAPPPPPPPTPVGGISVLISVPVDNTALLVSYIGLASTIAVATVAIAVCVKRVKRREEKQ